MNRIARILVYTSLLAVPTLGQNAPRVFDDFDTSRGVQVMVATPVTAKPQMKRNSRGKWLVAVEDKLVKKTSQTRMTVSVTESLALRDADRPKLVMGTGNYLKGFTTGDAVIDSFIVDSSRRYGVDPLLIYSQMHQESSFKLRALSPKGASGLMQLMPATARRFGVTSIYDPRQNIDAGVKYMRWLLDAFNGDLMLALAGYNAGEGAVLRYGWNIPPYRETQEYVRRITERYNSITDGRFVQTARRVNSQLAQKLEKKESRPLTVYEPDPLAIRLPDGRITLVNQ